MSRKRFKRKFHNLTYKFMKIRIYGDPILREVGKKITHFDQDLKKLAEGMFAVMYDSNGIGLAAQQVGYALQLFVVDLQLRKVSQDYTVCYDGKDHLYALLEPLVVINPKLKSTSEEVSTYEEGCLSFPGIQKAIIRPKNIHLSFQDLQGHPHTLTCNALLATCLQHENDHVQGRLFIDHLSSDEQKRIKPELRKLKRQTKAIIPE